MAGEWLALVAGQAVIADQAGLRRWSRRVEAWVADEGSWLQHQLMQLPGITPMPSSTNFSLIRSDTSLVERGSALPVVGCCCATADRSKGSGSNGCASVCKPLR